MRKIFGLCLFIGFFILIGTAGSSDIETISFEQMIIQGVIGLVFLIGGFFGLKEIGWES